MTTLPLEGVRFHLSASVPDEADEEQARGIGAFVEALVTAVLREGGTIMHGSHPTIVPHVEPAARRYLAARGNRDAIVLARSRNHVGPEHEAEIRAQREFAQVQILPSKPGDAMESLLPMREWMAERSDLTVAVGGRWWGENKAAAGVGIELDAFLERGKPAFVVAGFGGAARGYLEDRNHRLSGLHNGWSREQNERLAASTQPGEAAEAIVAQAKLLPLVRGNVGTRPRKLLVLDGGGIRGAFSAAVLARWAEMLGLERGPGLVGHFDLVAGTSTGAILAIGLGLGLAPSEILRFYREKGPEIFSDKRWTGSKYDAKRLRKILGEVFDGEEDEPTPLASSCCRLVVPTVRGTDGRAEVIVTPHTRARVGFREVSAVDAALASAAAPTYFDEAHVDEGIAEHRYLDGGLWANNPVVAAVAEAVGPLGWPIDRLDVLSIGTTESETDFTEKHGGGPFKWGKDLVDLFFAAQESGAARVADSLLGRSRHLRVNQGTPHKIDLAAADEIEPLVRRGSDAAKDAFESVVDRFFDGQPAADWRTELG